MRVVVVGAGVIGSVYASRIADAGHSVDLVARGRRYATLADDGLRVRIGGVASDAPVTIHRAEWGLPANADVVIVAVRATQLGPVFELLGGITTSTVVFLQHLGSHATEVASRVERGRAVVAFPGVGGVIHDDGTVEYVEVRAQPTTVDAAASRAAVVQELIASTGMRTRMEQDMAGWMATHEVFVSCLGAGILACGGDAAKLSADKDVLNLVVRAVREGFRVLTMRGISVTPPALRMLFAQMPHWFASAYWRRALRGPVGTIALAPHSRASREDEFPALCTRVLDRANGLSAPDLTTLLTPHRIGG